jgi:dolichyl-phosphate beta-glucosyltransferase
MRAIPQLSIVVPAYNEEHRLGLTVEEAVRYLRGRRTSFELIVVDDGSTDRTSALVDGLADRFAEVRLIRLAANGGKGLAVRTGVVNARGRTVLFMDADGATPIEELERLEAAVVAGADIAIGSRAVQTEDVRVKAKLYRHLIGRTFHWFVRTLAVRGIRDTQCGFKLFKAEAAQQIFSRMRMSGFSFDVEVLLMAQRRGFRIDEVPVNWTHRDGSKVNLMTDSLRMLRDVVVMRKHLASGAYLLPHVADAAGEPRTEGDIAAA